MLSKHRGVAKRTITFLVLGLAFAVFASSASANEVGQCSTHHVNTGQELFEAWKSEGVVDDSIVILSGAGFRHIDGDAHSFMRERVVKMKTAEATTLVDYGCSTSGGIFGAGTIYFPKGTTVMGVLPPKFDISDYCGIKPHKGCKRVEVRACVVGKVNCSNPLEGCAKLVFYVKVVTHRPKKHPTKKCGCHKKKHPKPKPQPKLTCEAQGLITVAGNCVQQSNNAKQECEAKVNGTWNGNQCTIVQINANCSDVAINEGSGTVIQGGNCNTTVIVPEEQPCGCIPKEPTIMITGKTELNMIPAGKTSGAFYVNVYASEAGGSLTVDPGIGGVSSCSSSTKEDSFTTSVPSGASKQCVVLYAPEDKDKPASMTVTMTACLGSVCDIQTETVPITYPIRP